MTRELTEAGYLQTRSKLAELARAAISHRDSKETLPRHIARKSFARMIA